MSELTHFDSEGNAIMVDVSEKPVTTRIAVATGKIYVCQEIFERIQRHEIAKGDVLGVALYHKVEEYNGRYFGKTSIVDFEEIK